MATKTAGTSTPQAPDEPPAGEPLTPGERAELEALRANVDELYAENRELRKENDQWYARQAAQPEAATSVKRPKLTEPSFGISEGTRDELERHGEANSPFTGKRLSSKDLPE